MASRDKLDNDEFDRGNDTKILPKDQIAAIFEELQDAAYDVGFTEGRKMSQTNRTAKTRLKAAEEAIQQFFGVKPNWTM